MRRRASLRSASAARAPSGTASASRISTRTRPGRTTRARFGKAYHGHATAHGRRERPDVKALQARHRVEGSLRKEHQGVPCLGAAQHPDRVATAARFAVTVHELRPDPPEQHARDRHGRSLALDHEREARRQHRLHEDAVEIARVVCDYHAGPVRQAIQPADADPEPEHGQGDARESAGEPASPVDAWHDEREDRRDDEHDGEDGERTHAVDGREHACPSARHPEPPRCGGRQSASPPGFCELVPVMLMVVGICEGSHDACCEAARILAATRTAEIP